MQGRYEVDRGSVAEVAKKHGIGERSIHTWCKRFGALDPADVKRLRQLEPENARLKKVVADPDLEIDVMNPAAAESVQPDARGLQEILLFNHEAKSRFQGMSGPKNSGRSVKLVIQRIARS